MYRCSAGIYIISQLKFDSKLISAKYILRELLIIPLKYKDPKSFLFEEILIRALSVLILIKLHEINLI